MADKIYTWHKIAESVADLQLLGACLTELNIAGKKICIVVHKDIIHACAATCPHAGGKMVDGYVDVIGNIVCPIHRYKFSLANGRNISGEGYFLKTYAVQQREEGIFVGI